MVSIEKPRFHSTRTVFSITVEDNMTSRFVARLNASIPAPSRNPSSAYYQLSRILRENNIRQELRLRHRYEKPTCLRKRLKSEAWRRRFGREVGQRVSTVMQMLSRGL